jgi:hypothetical protein
MMADNIDAAFNDIVRTDLAAEQAPPCECKCNGGEPHSDRLCGNRATMFVALHRWGWCNQPADAAGFTRPESVDEDGNITAMMCKLCATHAVRVAILKIKQMKAMLPPGHRDTAHCPSCGRPTVVADDILQVRPI